MSDFAERLKEERRRLNISQTELGELADVSKHTVIAWEKGNTSPTAFQLIELDKRGVDIFFLLFGMKSISIKNDLTRAELELIAQHRQLSDFDRETIDRMVSGFLSINP